MNNLAGNAIDAMRGQRGHLRLRVKETTEWQDDVKGVVITIADSGHGMSNETKERLFEAFYTTKETRGTGLGLWLSREIIARHDGHLFVRSSMEGVREGTTFRLFLPFQAISPAASGEKPEVTRA